MSRVDPLALEWQRKLDPSNFNKQQGAQYHTAPSVVVTPDSPDRPQDAPEGSVTAIFYIDGECWVGDLRKVVADAPEFIEGPPKTRRAKHGPVFVMTDEGPLCVIPVRQNYYWTAQVMCSQDVFRVTFIPDTVSKKVDRLPKVRAVVTFVPRD